MNNVAQSRANYLENIIMKQCHMFVSVLFLLSVPTLVLAGESAETMIARAVSAAPASVSDGATVMAVNGSVLREGTNGWICLPDTMDKDGAPMCNDKMWMTMMQAVVSKSDFSASGVGISYMLLGDKGAGVSNSDPYNPDPKSAADYVETGPHLMIIVPKELLEGMNDDPTTGGPYVMWKDTPYAHIMVPIADQ
jgi:hypothetical protein